MATWGKAFSSLSSLAFDVFAGRELRGETGPKEAECRLIQ